MFQDQKVSLWLSYLKIISPFTTYDLTLPYFLL